MLSKRLKRFRLRFSLRTLVIVVTLGCCYAACWGPTKKQGVEDVRFYLEGDQQSRTVDFRPVTSIGTWSLPVLRASARLPLVVQATQERDYESDAIVDHYYFWFFGYVAKLPYEREIHLER